MQLIYKYTIPQPLKSRSIYLLCVFRDEAILLESFVNHYRTLGVTHFIMIDNLSKDGGDAYLKQRKDINLLLYRANGSFKEAGSGTDWVDFCLKEHCVEKYCFVVDADELFIYDRRKFNTIYDLIGRMETLGANCVGATLLDMYPKVLNNDYSRGENLLKHSPYFDKNNKTFYKNKSVLYDKFLWKNGGMRMRVMGATPILQKFPFFKYDFQPLKFNVGYHFFQYKGKVLAKSNLIKLLPTPAVLLHFKYVKHDLLKVFKQVVANNQHWNNSSEYKLYVKALEEKKVVSFFDSRYSKKLSKIDDLSPFFKKLDEL